MDAGPTSQPEDPALAAPGSAGTSAHAAATSRALAAAVRAVSGVTLLSRVGGLARDVLVARLFGDTALGSAFSAGFAIPNLFRRLLGEGALSAAFIPEYAQAQKESREAADRFSSRTILWLGVVTGLLTVISELALLGILLLAPGDADRQMSLRLIMIMLPFMPFICVTALLGGMLQIHGKFGPAASGPLLLNGFIIVVGLWHVLRGETGSPRVAEALGVATALSGITQAMTFAWLLRGRASWRTDWQAERPRARRMWTKMLPALIGLGTLQLNTFLDQVIAMWPVWVGPLFLGFKYPLDESSNILIASAQRLYQFPLGVFGIAVATAVFPLLSRHADAPGPFGDALRRGLSLSFFIGFPASVGLILVNHDLVAALYGAGRHSGGGFSAEGVARTSAVLSGFAPAIWAYSVNHVFTRAFYAKGDTRTPMYVAMAMVGLNLCMNLTLIWWLREAGLAWATSVCAMLQSVILGLLCRRHVHTDCIDRGVVISIGKTLLVSAVMAAAVVSAMYFMHRPERWLDHVVRAAVGASVGVLVYVGAAFAFKIKELRWLVRR
ncbi:MAG TPA: murein biosynthesis integral membrane protein MurJ [Phycisphaerales bacterium]|nr:murein biosynthesis integral membrane protein MurJ [Phycisphaerales bacterium]